MSAVMPGGGWCASATATRCGIATRGAGPSVFTTGTARSGQQMQTAQSGEQSAQPFWPASADDPSATQSPQSAWAKRAATGRMPVLDRVRRTARRRMGKATTRHAYSRDGAQSTRTSPRLDRRFALRVSRMLTVVFACVHNAGRSQMAAAWFNELADPEHAIAVSAGTRPAAEVHPGVVAAMREVGIDLSGARPRKLTEEVAGAARLLVTMGCGESCPFVPGVEREDWQVADPKDQPPKVVRQIRDDIRERVRELLCRLGVPERARPTRA